MTNTNQNIISELQESKVIVERDYLVINKGCVNNELLIALSNIKQLSLDGDTKYIPWFLLIFLHVIIVLMAFGLSAHIPTFISWLILVIAGISGLCILLSPPENEFLVINMNQGDPVRVPMKDNRENKLEFIRKTNVHIYDLRK